MKRLLNYQGGDYLKSSPMELKQAILASEGRVIVSESVVSSQPYVGGLTNAEIERAFGADILLLNALDLENPTINGVPEESSNHLAWLKRATSRPLGVNLEPVDTNAAMTQSREELPQGRIASIKNYKLANDLGLDLICLTGNPGTGVTNSQILESIKEAKENFKGLVIAGKMHAAGTDGPVMNLEIAKDFIKAGIDILLVPAPYTVPHFNEDDLKEIADNVYNYNTGKNIEEKVLIMSAIGTSQETSDEGTIRQIALAAKANGAHLQHIGDAMNGISLPENIYTMGVAIRGVRWQMYQMSSSNYRNGEK